MKKTHICKRDGVWKMVAPPGKWTAKELSNVQRAYHFCVRLNGGQWRKDLHSTRGTSEYPKIPAVSDGQHAVRSGDKILATA